MKSISITDKFRKFDEQWTPKVIARMNDIMFKAIKIEGDFVWHAHEHTDEVFMVIEGSMRIDFRDSSGPLEPALLGPNDMCVIPRGAEHKPSAEKECRILVIEPAGTLNTGDNESGEMTAPTDDWI